MIAHLPCVTVMMCMCCKIPACDAGFACCIMMQGSHYVLHMLAIMLHMLHDFLHATMVHQLLPFDPDSYTRSIVSS